MPFILLGSFFLKSLAFEGQAGKLTLYVYSDMRGRSAPQGYFDFAKSFIYRAARPPPSFVLIFTNIIFNGTTIKNAPPPYRVRIPPYSAITGFLLSFTIILLR